MIRSSNPRLYHPDRKAFRGLTISCKSSIRARAPREEESDTFNCTLGMDTSVRVSHELAESSVTSPPSSFVEQYTMTTTYVSTTKLHNRHTGDYPANIVERSSIPIASEKDIRIKYSWRDWRGAERRRG